MRYLLFSSFLFLVADVFGQDFTIQRAFQDQEVIKGEMNKSQITLALQFVEYSPEHRGIVSVKGWYKYDGQTKSIPLVGILGDSLVLYHFDSQVVADSVLQFNGKSEAFWTLIEELCNKSNYQERFIFQIGQYGVSGTWTNKKKQELPVRLHVMYFGIGQEYEWLMLPNKTSTSSMIDLKELGLGASDFEVFSSVKTETGYRVLLWYSCISSGFVNGMCGAGLERGFVQMELGQNFEINQIEQFEVESCFRSIYCDMEEIERKEVLEIHVDNDNSIKHRLRIETKYAKAYWFE